MNKFAHKQFGVADNTYKLICILKEMNKKVVVVLFGSPYSIPNFNNADLIIEAYEDVVPAQKAAVDILCGTLQAQGKLPIMV